MSINNKKNSKKKLYKQVRSTKSVGEFEMVLKAGYKKHAIISEGDSWFAFPPEWIVAGAPSNLIDHLTRMVSKDCLILEMASNGDEVVNMTSGTQLHDLLRLIGKWDIDLILYSGGGNDIVGEYDMPLILQEPTDPDDWRSAIRMDILDHKLQHIQNAYRLLIEYVKANSKNPAIKIITHTYDFPIPTKKKSSFLSGMVKLKPWIGPYMADKNITKKSMQREIARFLLSSFKDRLRALAAAYPDTFEVVDTQGTVSKNQWYDEIHPNTEGFKAIADKIFGVMQPHL